MAELINFVTQKRGAKFVSPAFLIEILMFSDIKHQTWFFRGNGISVCWTVSPGLPLIFFIDKANRNYPSGLSKSTFFRGFLKITPYTW